MKTQMKNKASARLIVSKPFLDELRDRVAISALNDEAQMETIYLQKAADEIERLQTQVARLVKAVIRRERRGQLTPPTTNGVKLYRSLIKVDHGGYECMIESRFAAKDEHEAQACADRHASKLFAGARLDAENCWSTSSGDIAWSLLNVIEVNEICVSGTDGKLYVFDVARRPASEARHAS